MKNRNIAIIGLGYVGLPLAVEFGKQIPTVGFDIDAGRISDLREGYDRTLEVDKRELLTSVFLSFSNTKDDIKHCNIFIVTVPTPINKNKQPDLEPLNSATKLVGTILKKNDIVIFESTVFPGATEENCVPILEAESGLKYNDDFFCGYSPERVNPGDTDHRIPDIMKVTSGSTPEIAEKIDKLYQKIITAGTYKANSIRVAEASKVIENTQRDINIGLINELALIFNKLNIDTDEVLKAASTKWNFLNFRPGLVGGHCIGVDPYYLMHKAQSVGYHPEIILAGRRLNDGMGGYISSQLVKLMLKKCIQIQGSKVLIMGLTFKENCTDIRNTKVVDIVNQMQEYGAEVECFDPWASPVSAREEYGIELVSNPSLGQYDAIIIAVAHTLFFEMGMTKIRALCKANGVVFDVKSMFEISQSDGRL